jgi:hypothetical protein
VYNFVVNQDGFVEKMYPGYWKAMLEELNLKLRKLAKLPAKPFDAAYAPVEPSSGCYFTP